MINRNLSVGALALKSKEAERAAVRVVITRVSQTAARGAGSGPFRVPVPNVTPPDHV